MDKKKALHYQIKFSYDPDRGVFSALIPALGNLLATGETFAEAEANIRDAALQYLEAMHLDDMPLPLQEHDLEEGIYIRIPRE